MASDVSGEAFNVGSGGEASVREITERLIALTGSDVEPHYDLEQRVLMRRRVGLERQARPDARLVADATTSTRVCAT